MAETLAKAAISLGSIYISWWALQALRFDRFVAVPGSRQAKLLHLLLAVIVGRQFSAFLFDYIGWTLR